MTQCQCGAGGQAQEQSDAAGAPTKGQNIDSGQEIAEEGGVGAQQRSGRGGGAAPVLQGHAVPGAGGTETDTEGAASWGRAQPQVLCGLLIGTEAEDRAPGQTGGTGY